MQPTLLLITPVASQTSNLSNFLSVLSGLSQIKETFIFTSSLYGQCGRNESTTKCHMGCQHLLFTKNYFLKMDVSMIGIKEWINQ